MNERHEHVPAEIFSEDYDYFYADLLTADRSDADAELVKRLARLEAGQRVLDVPCGNGRIAFRLAALGCVVVGVDRDRRLIESARAAAPAAATFVVGDMRELNWRAEFDCVVNWFSSFGYFDTDVNRQLLEAFHQSLKPGGRLILDQVNPDRVRRAIDAAGGVAIHMTDRGLDLMIDRLRLDGRRVRAERFVVRNGQVRKLEFSLELVSRAELEVWLRDAGFASVEFFDETGERAGDDSRRLIVVGETKRGLLGASG